MAVSNLTLISLVEAHVPPREGRAATRSIPAAGTACQTRGCTVPGSLECAYVDSRGHSCGTRWCPRHLQRVGNAGYCRRHASTVAALGARADDPRALPPVAYRGASLVSWICTEGHALLHEAVTSGLRPGEVVFPEHSVNVARGEGGRRRWKRGWRIGDRGGMTGKVLICVDESDDALVFLQVDERVVAAGVPPWVTRRRAQQRVTPAVDEADRTQFYGFLVDQIRRALATRS
ncbi:MAG: hypothetical protein ACLQT7_01355 [Candidatus Dormibacteria bacterium]